MTDNNSSEELLCSVEGEYGEKAIYKGTKSQLVEDGKAKTSLGRLEGKDMGGSESLGRRNKAWKVRKEKGRMVLGRDVGLMEVTQLSLLTLVGNFGYGALAKVDLGWWLEEK